MNTISHSCLLLSSANFFSHVLDDYKGSIEIQDSNLGLVVLKLLGSYRHEHYNENTGVSFRTNQKHI